MILAMDDAQAKDDDGFVVPKEFRTIKYHEYGGGPARLYLAPKFEEHRILDDSPHRRLIWTTSLPPTTATKTVVAGLFILIKRDGKWIVSDSKRFHAIGKYSGAKAEMTNSKKAEPHVTVTLAQGGRGHAFSQSITYRVEKGVFELDVPVEIPVGEQGEDDQGAAADDSKP